MPAQPTNVDVKPAAARRGEISVSTGGPVRITILDPAVVQATWSKEEASDGEKIELRAKLERADDGAEVVFRIMAADGDRRGMVAEIASVAREGGKSAVAEWTVDAV